MRSLRFLPVPTAALTATLILVAATSTSAQQPGKPAGKKLDQKVYEHFGAGIRQGMRPISLAAALKNPAAHTGKKIRLEGPITGVCQTKGCWMNLGKPDAKGNPPMFVKFTDYAFFVPKGAAGCTAIVDGTMTMTQETVAQTRHYLEDAGKHEQAKKVTEGRKLYSFMADGVAITKAGKLDESRYAHFGAGILRGTKPLTLAAIMNKPADFTGKKIRLTGPITGVCQTKGCWMNLGKPDAQGNPPVFVKFKDYAFFVPKDASGRNALLEGTMTMTQETVEQTRHYLKDAGKLEQAKQVTVGRKIYRFMADGVAIEKPKKAGR